MKKILSLILAMSMVLSMTVGASFVSADVGETATIETERVYNLLSLPESTNFWTLYSYDLSKTNFHYLDASADMEMIMAGTDVKDSSGNVIAKASDLKNRLLRHNKDNTSDYFRFNTIRNTSKLPNGQWFAMKLKTENLQEGIYDVKFDISDGAKTYTVYLAPYKEAYGTNAAPYMDNKDNMIGTRTFTDKVDTLTIGSVEIVSSAKEYVIIIKQGVSEETRINKITLTRTDDLKYSKKYSFDSTAFNYTDDQMKQIWNSDTDIKAAAKTILPLVHFGTHGYKYLDADAFSKSIIEKGAFRPMQFYNYLNLCGFYDAGTGAVNTFTNIDGTELALELQAPNSPGFYVPSIYKLDTGKNGEFIWYFSNADENATVGSIGQPENIVYNGSTFTIGDPDNDCAASKIIWYDGSENLATLFHIGSTGTLKFKELTLAYVEVIDASLDVSNREIEVGNTAKATFVATLSTGGTKSVADAFVNYSVQEVTDTIDVAADGTITAKGAGSATITAEVGGKTASAEITVTAPEEDEDFIKEFTGENGYTTDDTPAFEEENPNTTVNVYAAVLGGTTGDASANTVAVGEIFETTAAETDANGNIFRYWALGLTANKKILTRERTLKVMATTDVKHVIAVYEPADATATVSGESFYNANGQLLTDVSITDGNKMPALPSMAGYGTASVWVQYGTGAEFAEGAEAPADNRMFVAKYDDPTTTYAIDVVDGLGKGSYTYGEEVTCKATVPTGKVFKCWTKTVGEDTRIISLDEEYTFNVWEACTLTAVFADDEPIFTGNKFSIILSSMGNVGGNTAYMAEFVGLGDAVEKGVVFGNKRVAMTTDAAQFTVVNDTTETDVKGYAILSDGTVIYDK